MDHSDLAQLDPAFATPAADPDDGRFRSGWAAVFMLAVLDYWCAKPGSEKFRSAMDWIFYSGAVAPNSFDNVVGFLGLGDPQRVRVAISRRRAELSVDPAARARMLTLLAGQGNGTRRVAAIDDDDDQGGGV